VLDVLECVFLRCVATNYRGGGIYASYISFPTVKHSFFLLLSCWSHQ
jgi:predicted outer membrane repeat protein